MKKDYITADDFGTLAICALRYCHGRRTYMPGLVREIVANHAHLITDKDLKVMLEDCEFQKRMSLYGEEVDKQEWLEWKAWLENEERVRARFEKAST